MFRNYCMLFAILLATTAWGQTTSAPGEEPSAAPASEEAPINVISGGLGVSNYFDDNGANSVQKRSNLATFLEPHLSWQTLRGRMKWSLEYRPAFAWSRRMLSCAGWR